MENIVTSRLILKPIEINDEEFIEELFSDKDFIRFYSQEKNYDLHNLFLTMVQKCGRGFLNYVIQTKNREDIGYIEAGITNIQNEVSMWNVGYAILPFFRNNGYATEALIALTNLLGQYNISSAYASINEENASSQKVAKKAGYKKDLKSRHINYDQENHPVYYYWKFKFCSARNEYFSLAIRNFRIKNYQESVRLFMKAKDEPYEGDANTDALCFSNMGMAYSSMGNYTKAYFCLKTAQDLGLNNSSIENELNWLRINQGIG